MEPEPTQKTTSGASEPHAPTYKTERAQRGNEGPTREDEQEKLEPTPTSEKETQKQDFIASMRESHDELSDLTEANLAEYTSLVVAYMRAAETKRDDAIIHDQYAELLAGDAGAALLQFFSKWSPHMINLSVFTALRTRSIDEALIHRGDAIQQLVILGAGLDSRAYRLKALADCLVIEVDSSASMMERKQTLLADAGAHVLAKDHHVIIADLEQDMWMTELVSKGFNPKAPTFWLLEGLLYYLPYDSNVRLMKTIDALSAPKSQVWADISGYALVKGSDDNAEGVFRTRALKYGENDPTKGVLSLLQWPMEVVASLDAPRELYGRAWTPFSVTSADGDAVSVPWFFVTATKAQMHPSPEPLL